MSSVQFRKKAVKHKRKVAMVKIHEISLAKRANKFNPLKRAAMPMVTFRVPAFVRANIRRSAKMRKISTDRLIENLFQKPLRASR